MLLPNLPFQPQVGLYCRNLEGLKVSKIYEFHREDGNAILLEEAMNVLEGSLVGDSSDMKSLSKGGVSKKSVIRGNTSQIGVMQTRHEEEHVDS